MVIVEQTEHKCSIFELSVTEFQCTENQCSTLFRVFNFRFRLNYRHRLFDMVFPPDAVPTNRC